VLLGIVGAVIVGTILGLLLSRGGHATTTAAPVDPGVLPEVTAAPLPTPSPFPTTFPTLSGQPSPRVFTVTPTPSPGSSGGLGPSSASTASPEPATEPLSLTLDPTSGPNGATLSVQGTGWTPRGNVTLDYLDPLGRQTGSHATVTVDARGRFTTTLSAQDPSNLPGRHTVRANDGTQTASAAYQVTG
jgi:hypothetical protein